ncbi:hypothetical protein, partial [Piscinibacter defluvii]|uniref:hypothetical protein n=1 Tax=Piscinibacter defluvii TaxID=1796922 RepID=UPI00197C60EB
NLRRWKFGASGSAFVAALPRLVPAARPLAGGEPQVLGAEIYARLLPRALGVAKEFVSRSLQAGSSAG